MKIQKLLSAKIPISLPVFSVGYLLIIVLSLHLHMFWDMSYIAKTANLIYDNKFSSLIFPAADNGTPPLYSLYLAGLWMVFGKSIWVCHFAVLPFALGMMWQFYKLAARFLSAKYAAFALLLLFIEPTIATQTLLAGYDIAMCFLFLAALNSLLGNRRFVFGICLLFLPVLNMRGFSIVVSLFIIDVFYHFIFNGDRKKWINFILPYIPALLLFAAWLAFHREATGWFVVSANKADFHHVKSIGTIITNLGYVVWKIFDFGRIALFLVIISMLYGFFKEKNKTAKQLGFILLCTLIPYLLFFMPFAYPVSHRYFMITYVIAIILFIYSVQQMKRKALKIGITTLAVLALLSGNFILYPQRLGNGWDASLKVLPYFKLKQQFDNYVQRSGMKASDIGADFPMNADNYDYLPGSLHFTFTDIDAKPFNAHPYIVLSNICNTFAPSEIETLEQKWILIKEIHSCRLYIKLYKNPE